MPITDEEMNIRPSAEKARREVVKTQTGPGVSKTIFEERADQKFRTQKRREELDVIESQYPPTIGGLDQSTSDRMRAALEEAALRARGEQMSNSIGGITPEEAQASEIRMLNTNRRQDMMDYFMNSPVGRLERSGLEALSNVAGAAAVKKGAGLLGGLVPSTAAGRAVGAANQQIGNVSSRVYYGTSTPNYALKGIGGPTGGMVGMLDDVPVVGALADVNKLRYTIANPGYYARTAMNKQVFKMTGRAQ